MMKAIEPIARGLLVSAAVSLLACGHDEPPMTPDPALSPPSAQGGAPSLTAAQAPILTNDQILEVTHTANLGEIEQARIAQSKSQDNRVQQLAAMMIRDHSQADAKGRAVAEKDGLTQQASPTSELLQSDADGATRDLKAQGGAGFDKDYVETQVREHQAVLDTLDKKLIPNATNPDVEAYLDEVRTSVAVHLLHAQALQHEMQP
jgi:putative membrane protein